MDITSNLPDETNDTNISILNVLDTVFTEINREVTIKTLPEVKQLYDKITIEMAKEYEGNPSFETWKVTLPRALEEILYPSKASTNDISSIQQKESDETPPSSTRQHANMASTTTTRTATARPVQVTTETEQHHENNQHQTPHRSGNQEEIRTNVGNPPIQRHLNFAETPRTETTRPRRPTMTASSKKRQEKLKAKKKRRKEKKRKKKERRKKRKSKSGGDDGDDGSSSSSSSDSSFASDSESDFEDDASYNALDDNGNFQNISHLGDAHLEDMATKKVAKILKRLVIGAKNHDLRELDLARGTVERRKSFYRLWIQTIQTIFQTESKYQALLMNYPQINYFGLTISSNVAMAQFLGIYIKQASMNTIIAAIGIENRLNGIDILKYLNNAYGGTSMLDAEQAMERLKDVRWDTSDTIDSFTNRFMKRVTDYNTSVISAQGQSASQPLKDIDILLRYLKALVLTMPQDHALFTKVEDKYEDIEEKIQIGETVKETFSRIQETLRRQEANRALSSSRRQPTTREPDMERSRRYNPRSNNNNRRPPPRGSKVHKANAVHTSQKFRGEVKCWSCGRSHHMRNCPTTSEEDKQAIYERKRQERESARSRRSTEEPRQQANNTTDTGDNDERSTTSRQGNTSKTVKLQRRRGSAMVARVRHQACATTTQKQYAMPTKAKASDGKTYTLISDWLIDSGCSANMTPNYLDFIPNSMEKYETIVETANGGIVRVNQKGNVLMLLIDAFEPNKQQMVCLQDVLYVPGLNRRLLSVGEWNQCGGMISFLQDRCRMTLLDEHDEPSVTIDVEAAFSMEDTAPFQALDINEVKIHKLPQGLIHRRLGGRAFSTIQLADEDNIWKDVKLIPEVDDFCTTGKITVARKADRGNKTLEETNLIPGTHVMVDIVDNPCKAHSITSNTQFKYYLCVTDVASRFFVPIGLKEKTAEAVCTALQRWAIEYGPSVSYDLSQLVKIGGDHDSAFTSAELEKFAREHGIQVKVAAPRHQEQNGIHEATWRNVRNLAFYLLNNGRVPLSFWHYAFRHAAKLHAVLPNSALTKTDGTVQCPLNVYRGSAISISHLRVLFCPVVMETNTGGDRKTEPQRAIRGIHVGVPDNSAGYLVYTPGTGLVNTSSDVYFDEDFKSPIAFHQHEHKNYLDMIVTTSKPTAELGEHTGSAMHFSKKGEDGILQYALPQLTDREDAFVRKDATKRSIFPDGFMRTKDGIKIYALVPPHKKSQWHLLETLLSTYPEECTRHILERKEKNDPDVVKLFEEHGINLITPPKEEKTHKISQPPEDDDDSDDDDDIPDLMTRSIDDDDDSSTDSEEQPDQDLPSMRTRSRTQARNTAHVATTPNIIGREIQAEMQQAFVAEVLSEEDNLSRMNPAPFLPPPDKWQQVLKLPTSVRKAWTKSFIKELKEIIKKDTVSKVGHEPGDPIIPVTAKFRVKLNPDGTIEKLKTRIALRGDMMTDNVSIGDTWCPNAGFRAYKMYLAFAAMMKVRIYQLDYVAAFLQADVLGRKSTTFPEQWKEILEGEPELQSWCGIPLRLNKSLYGDRVANLAWDKTQSEWLTSPEIGFSRLPSEGSIYIKRVGNDIIAVLNAVDDQCYFATNNELKVWFEEATKKRFDVQLLGQAQWYLQSRITQCADYSIILDQSRYAALIIERYLPNLPSKTLTPRSIKAYEAPLPPTAVFTKKDCSENYLGRTKARRRIWIRICSSDWITHLPDEHIHTTCICNSKTCTIHAISWQDPLQAIIASTAPHLPAPMQSRN